MRFDIKKEVIIGDKVFNGYVNEHMAIFAICNTERTVYGDMNEVLRWVIVHIPSDEVVFDIFNTKKDVELFFDFFAEIIDIDSLIFLNCGKSLREDLDPILLKAYKEYYRIHRRV